MPRFLVVLDVDSTLIENEAIDLLAEAAGMKDEVTAITATAMDGSLDFETSLRQRVAMLAGLSEDALGAVRERMQLTPGAEQLIEVVRASGGRVGAVSGGFHDLIDPLAAGLKLDRWRANCLDVVDGVLTGKIRGPVIDARAKAAALQEWADIYSIPLRHTIAVGDGANDILMLGAAGLAVGFDAKSAVRNAANVLITVRDLSQVLPLLGLRG